MSLETQSPPLVIASKEFPFRTLLLPEWPSASDALLPDVRPILKAITFASQQRDATPETAIAQWARHPDERVTIALLAERCLPLSREVVDFIARRAFRNARREGAILTPTLDALLRRYSLASELNPKDAMLHGHSARALSRRCDELRAWVRANNSGIGIYKLLGFSSYDVHEIVIRSARALLPAWIELSAALHPDLMLSVPRAPHLAPDTGAHLMALLLRRAVGSSDALFMEILDALRDLTFNREFSAADCAQVVAVLDGRDTDASPAVLVYADLLEHRLAESLARVQRTAVVNAADLARLLSSESDAIRLAAFDLAGELTSQAV